MTAFRTMSLAAALAITTAAGASAATVTLTYTGATAGSFGKVTLSHLPAMPAGSVTTSGNTVLAGAFSFTRSVGDVVDSIVGWCMDLSTFLKQGAHPYTPSASFIGGVGDVAGAGDRVQRLFDAVFHLVDPTDRVQSTAMQTAIWEVIYDTDFSLAGGSFRATSGLTGVFDKAQEWLGLARLHEGGPVWQMTYFNAGGRHQNIGTATRLPPPPPPPIPLPAAGWLLLGGLAALGTVARRRSPAAA